jgi:hypothetical protein
LQKSQAYFRRCLRTQRSGIKLKFNHYRVTEFKNGSLTQFGEYDLKSAIKRIDQSLMMEVLSGSIDWGVYLSKVNEIAKIAHFTRSKWIAGTKAKQLRDVAGSQSAKFGSPTTPQILLMTTINWVQLEGNKCKTASKAFWLRYSKGKMWNLGQGGRSRLQARELADFPR